MTTPTPSNNPYASPQVTDLSPESIIASFKGRNKVLMLLVTLVTLWCVPCAFAIAFGVANVTDQRALLFIPIVVLACMMVSMLVRVISDYRYRAFSRVVAKRLMDDQIDVAFWQGKFVQFAPHSEVRFYDMHTEWDVGYLFLFSDRWTYIGEQARFTIPRSDLHEISVRYGSFDLPMSYRLQVQWTKPEKSEYGQFCVWPGITEPLQNNWHQVIQLAREIRDWQRYGAAQQPPPWSDLPCPNLEAIPSKTVDEVAPIPGQIIGGIGIAAATGLITLMVLSIIDIFPRWWSISNALSASLFLIISVLIRIWLQRLASKSLPAEVERG